jgi:hypothetical protein
MNNRISPLGLPLTANPNTGYGLDKFVKIHSLDKAMGVSKHQQQLSLAHKSSNVKKG